MCRKSPQYGLLPLGGSSFRLVACSVVTDAPPHRFADTHSPSKLRHGDADFGLALFDTLSLFLWDKQPDRHPSV